MAEQIRALGSGSGVPDQSVGLCPGHDTTIINRITIKENVHQKEIQLIFSPQNFHTQKLGYVDNF